MKNYSDLEELGILKGGKEISNSKAVFFFIYIEEGICGGNGENFLKS